MEKQKKILGVQYLRGLAALAVVFCHFGSSLSSYPKLSTIFNEGQSGIYVFFLISGFIIVYSLVKSDYKPQRFFTFLLKRSIRIDPTYWVAMLLTITVFKILSYIPSFKGSAIAFIPGQFIAHVFYVVPFTKYAFYNHVFWTLGVEFQFYLLIGLLYFLSKKPLYKSIFVIIFCLTYLIPLPNSYYLVFTYAPMFALGISLVNFYQNRNWVNSIVPAFVLLLIGVEFGVVTFILLLVSCIVILYFNRVIKSLTFLGDISYSLYLTHSLTFVVFTGIVKKLHANLDHNQLLWLFIEIVVAIGFAYVIYVLIESPSLRLSKRIFYKRKKHLPVNTVSI